MGGGYSLDVALQEPTLAATVINYGHLATDPEALKKINAPILGLFGAQDHGITPDDVHKFEHALQQLGKKIDIKIYDDAGHAFENPNNKDGYRAADAADAWKRTVDFLAHDAEEMTKNFRIARNRPSGAGFSPAYYLYAVQPITPRAPVPWLDLAPFFIWHGCPAHGTNFPLARRY